MIFFCHTSVICSSMILCGYVVYKRISFFFYIVISLSEDIRSANIISEDCTCIVIDGDSFKQLIGNLDGIKHRYSDGGSAKRR